MVLWAGVEAEQHGGRRSRTYMCSMLERLIASVEELLHEQSLVGKG